MHADAVGNLQRHHVQLLRCVGKGLIIQGRETEMLCLRKAVRWTISLQDCFSQDTQETIILGSNGGFIQEPCIYKELTLKR